MKVIPVIMRYQILILLKTFEFEPKRNIGDINSSSSDDVEEGIEDKGKQINLLPRTTFKKVNTI